MQKLGAKMSAARCQLNRVAARMIEYESERKNQNETQQSKNKTVKLNIRVSSRGS